MTAGTRPAPRSSTGASLDPFRGTWRLLTNVKFALFLVGTVTAVSMLGVIFPQVPEEMRSNPVARAAWIENQRETFGAFTGLLERFDLFEIFTAPWYLALWGVVIVAVTVCTVSRFRPTARSVHRPQKDVPDRYFETAKQRAAFSHPGGVEAVEANLRGRRYRVERTRTDGDTTYLFAERFGWAQYATFLSHLALLMLLIGGLLTALAGFQRTLALAEGRTASPLFSTPGPDQIFIQMHEAYQGIDEAGNVIDFRSELTLRQGDEAITCTTTVNEPCSAFGYRFHQAAFFDDLAWLSVFDPDGRLLFDDIVDFENEATAVPHIKIVDADGEVIFDQSVPQMASAITPGFGAAELPVPVVRGASSYADYSLAWGHADDALLLELAGPGVPVTQLFPGDEIETRDHVIRFRGVVSVPAIEIADMPGATTRSGIVTIQMPRDRQGTHYLYISGVDGDNNVLLRPGQEHESAGGYTYRFARQVDGAGIDVRRDPGSTFIWIAVGMAMVGLGITFYVPRRRLWLKITPERTYVAGIAERTTRLARELRFMGADLGAKDALLPEDREEP